ncbi:hypothetical protein [Chitinivorax sp. B]|uniref:hypothetical protein n=1 Tax=Chitinivorax sp. B TaxID=2502235 RepID=UPI0010F6CF55|nr:hypothetical protein [Chitinivorax sp. B]
MPDVYALLQEWEQPAINTLVTVLNESGIATDEDRLGLSSTMIEGWTDDCSRLLYERGYIGGEIRIGAKFFPESGAIYAVYDSASYELSEVIRHLEQINANAKQ